MNKFLNEHAIILTPDDSQLDAKYYQELQELLADKEVQEAFYQYMLNYYNTNNLDDWDDSVVPLNLPKASSKRKRQKI